jgi:hypothetical protein
LKQWGAPRDVIQQRDWQMGQIGIHLGDQSAGGGDSLRPGGIEPVNPTLNFTHMPREALSMRVLQCRIQWQQAADHLGNFMKPGVAEPIRCKRFKKKTSSRIIA